MISDKKWFHTCHGYKNKCTRFDIKYIAAIKVHEKIGKAIFNDKQWVTNIYIYIYLGDSIYL